MLRELKSGTQPSLYNGGGRQGGSGQGKARVLGSQGDDQGKVGEVGKLKGVNEGVPGAGGS